MTNNRSSIEALIRGIDVPSDLVEKFEELDEEYDGWNALVRGMKKRQKELENSGPNGTIGYNDLQRFQSRFNSLDPLVASRERRFGSTAIKFNGYIVERVDDSGRSSTEIKSPGPTETIESAQCKIELYRLEVPSIKVPEIKLLSMKVIDAEPQCSWGIREYLENPDAQIIVPAANLLER